MPWHNVRIEIVDIQGTGKCSQGHKVGDLFETVEEHKKICGSAYNTLYPYLIGLKSGGSFPWEDDPDSITLCCADYKNPVVFKLTRITDIENTD